MASRKQERQLQQAREAGQIEPEMDTETGATCFSDNVESCLSCRLIFIADVTLSFVDCAPEGVSENFRVSSTSLWDDLAGA